jgi:hypothetical protein
MRDVPMSPFVSRSLINESCEKQKGVSMIAERQVWGIIQGHVPRKQWVSSEDIFALVELHGKPDAEDLQPLSPRSRTPKWKALVRNVLADNVKKGRIRARKRLSA